MKVDREGFLAAVAALGLLVPGLQACDSSEDAADAGAGGEAAGGSGAGGEAAGGAGAGGLAAGGGGGSAAEEEVEDPCAGEDLLFSISWDEDVAEPLHVDLRCGTASTYKFGIAETGAGANGWYGEDCLPGESSGYDYCHTFDTDGGLLFTADTPAEVEEGSSTLVDVPLTPNLTFVIIDGDDPTKCWVTGNDPTYYDSLGCTVQ
jgi:hypothetical protein